MKVVFRQFEVSFGGSAEHIGILLLVIAERMYFSAERDSLRYPPCIVLAVLR